MNSMVLVNTWTNMHEVLRSVYDEMMPLCENMIGVAKGLAGLGALFYIAYRVWQSIARAEPIDVFPLLRPFVIGLCIMFFPTVVLGTLEDIMSPITRGTGGLLETQLMNLQQLQEEKDNAERQILMDNPSKAWLVDEESFDKRIDAMSFGVTKAAVVTAMHIEREMYNFRKWIRECCREFFENIFHAAALTIDVLRTFYLIVLAILGPISFALSVYDGFQSTLTFWLTKYISVWLWLPIADMFTAILSKIQSLMLVQDIEAIRNTAYSGDSSDKVYIIFFLIGIVGYFCVPTVAGWIIQAGGGAGNYGKNVNGAISKGGALAGAGAGSVAGNIIGRLTKK